MNKENRRNYYRILHVQPDAPTEIIKASYRTLMQKLRAHPDLGGDEWNASVINEAYRVLTDKGQRNAYDQHLCNARSEFDPAKRRSRAPTGSTYRTTRHHPDKRSSGRHRCLFCSTESPSGIRGYSEGAASVAAAPSRALHRAHAARTNAALSSVSRYMTRSGFTSPGRRPRPLQDASSTFRRWVCSSPLPGCCSRIR